MVKRLLMAVSMFTAIAGCATQEAQPILTPMEVKVPIATPIYCKVGKLDRPALPLAALKADSAPTDTIRAYAATVAILKGAVRERDSVIAGCAPPTDANVGAPVAGADSDGATK